MTAPPPPAETGADDLYRPAVYFNRELSWLRFNARVLDEALDPSVPLLERLKFLGIVSSNLDEFFMIRVAGLRQQWELGITDLPPDGMTPEEQLTAIAEEVARMVERQSACMREEILPSLAKEGIILHDYDSLEGKSRSDLERYFTDEVFPVLTPLAIDPSHPFPRLLNRSLNLIMAVLDPETREERIAVVQVPGVLPRLVRVPGFKQGDHFIPLEEIIAAHADRLFPGLQVTDWHPFRVTRNADLDIAEDEAADLLKTVEEELHRRRWGKVVRLEIGPRMPKEVRKRLSRALGLKKYDVFQIDGPLNLVDFMALCRLDYRHLKDKPFTPRVVEAVRDRSDIFDAIRETDILLHHPYDSFSTIVELVQAAAEDPKVLAIKLTLYRTSGDSKLVQALADAAANGKQVTACVELKARFDEENNIIWARALEQAGVHVVYGLIGIKIHCKVALIVRREKEGIRTYAHLSTGNYNEVTARVYTDVGYLTANPAWGYEATALFNYLTGFSRKSSWEKIVIAPVSMRRRLLDLIQREAARSAPGRPGRIVAKMNALVDAQIIRALYRASQAGVGIDLLVRGICCLKPGVPGLSDRIRVRSIVGRFLEHSRIFFFRNGGEEEVYLSSADWMPRNLNRRVETLFPIERKDLRDRLIAILDLHWRDTVKARELQPDGSYLPLTPRQDEEPVNSQEEFLRIAQRPYEEPKDDHAEEVWVEREVAVEETERPKRRRKGKIR